MKTNTPQPQKFSFSFKALSEVSKKILIQVEGKVKAWIQEGKIIREKMKDLAKTNYELGRRHLELGNFSDAKFRFNFVLRMRPDHAGAHYGLGCCRQQEGKTEEALTHFRRALELQPDLSEAQYQLALLDPSLTPKRVPIEAVKKLFASMAPVFTEEFITKQDYQGHLMIYDAIHKVVPEDIASWKVLELGCGTGICGELLRQRKRIGQLVGVDIVAGMIDKARSLKIAYKPVYNDLIQQDMLEYITQTSATYHMVIAAASPEYIGELEPLFRGAARVLAPQGVIGCTLVYPEDKDSASIKFIPALQRFTHGLAYADAAAAKAGLTRISLVEGDIYKSRPGAAVLWQKSS